MKQLRILSVERDLLKAFRSSCTQNFLYDYLNCKLSNSQPVSSATLDSTRVAQIRIPWETAEVNNSQR